MNAKFPVVASEDEHEVALKTIIAYLKNRRSASDYKQDKLPRIPGTDDLTGEPLVQRPDDRPEVYARRLVSYERATAPLLGYYKRRAEEERVSMRGSSSGLRIVTLAGETSDEMWPRLEGAVRELFPTVKPRLRAIPNVVEDNAKTRIEVSPKSREAVATLTAAAETKENAREAAEEAVEIWETDRRSFLM